MKYLSVCSGIEAATVAWKPLGWSAVAFSEIEKFPSAVLEHHYPDIPNYGDMNDFKRWPEADIDVLVGGTPCQSFSVAGLRKGMADPRGNLALVYLAIAERYRPDWVVWENVPGALSSVSHDAPNPCSPPPPVDLGCDGAEVETLDDYDADETHALACLLAGFQELGYFGSYRVLDAQYFGVPQRRRRVFFVGHLGDWRRAAEVLFEPESLRRHPPPSREARQEIAAPLTAGSGVNSNDPGRRREDDINLAVSGPLGGASQSGGFRTTDLDNHGAYIPETVGCLTARGGRNSGMANDDLDAERIITGPGRTDISHALSSRDAKGPCSNLAQGTLIAFAQNQRDEVRLMDKAEALAAEPGAKQQTYLFSIMPQNSGKDFKARQVDMTQPLMAAGQSYGNQGSDVLLTGMAVRRLTPLECERLQGFPDGYTDIPSASDSARYKALGNSMAVPCMAWIGGRISYSVAAYSGS